jgi:hypothetical protein
MEGKARGITLAVKKGYTKILRRELELRHYTTS